jgi:hypothetical protein
MGQTMNPLLIPFAVLCGFVLGGVFLAFVAITRTKALARVLEERMSAQRARSDAAVDSIKQTLDSLSSQIDELHKRAATLPAIPRAGFNLSKRSQALRMHRRGEPPEQIALALDVPLQEVDLLIKVHRIVISSI